MAASVSAWSKPGNWALDSEKEELLSQNPPAASADFPSLSAAATTKTKKKKAQTISLAEFSAKSTYSAPSSQTLFDEAPLSLPSGPRERTAEELDRTRLGGGFRSYGGDSSSRWGSGRGGDEGRRSARSPARESGPSRADEADDWGATKRSTVGNGFDRRDRDRDRGERGGGGFFDSQSRADELESWVSSKSSVPTEGRRFGGFDRERRGGGGGFERESSNGGGADSDNWGRKREDSAPLSSNGRPRLVLQPRTLPVSPVAVTPSPVSPVTPEKVEAPVMVPKPRGSNPFGQARPREEVLAEKGQDWKEIDEKLEAVKIKETGEKAERGRRGFGNGNGRAGLQEERSWRKPETGDDACRPGSAERADNEVFEENGRGIDEQHVTEG